MQEENSSMDTVKSLHILIVEDNIINQQVIKGTLTREGYEVDTARNGREAVEKFTADPKKYDIILMDIKMPVMDGYTATSEIRKIDRHGIPIIAITFDMIKEDRDKCLDAGMDDYLTTPVKPELLLETIAKYVK